MSGKQNYFTVHQLMTQIFLHAVDDLYKAWNKPEKAIEWRTKLDTEKPD